MQTLTPREKHVLTLISHGRTGPEIANLLGIKLTTVKTHRAKMERKLHALNSPHAVALAIRSGVIK